jgi:hypothetical protein
MLSVPVQPISDCQIQTFDALRLKKIRREEEKDWGFRIGDFGCCPAKGNPVQEGKK